MLMSGEVRSIGAQYLYCVVVGARCRLANGAVAVSGGRGDDRG